jgi:hypothetical protein
LGQPSSFGAEQDDLEGVDEQHEDVEAEEDGRRSAKTFSFDQKSGQSWTHKISQ